MRYGRMLTLLKAIFDKEGRRRDVVYKIAIKNITGYEKEYSLRIVGDDLFYFGFDENDEPTDEGLLLEEIIDFINRIPVQESAHSACQGQENDCADRSSEEKTLRNGSMDLLRAIFTQEKYDRADIVGKIVTKSMNHEEKGYAIDAVMHELLNYGVDDDGRLTNAGSLMKEIMEYIKMLPPTLSGTA